MRQQPCFHQRRLSTSAGAIDQAHAEGVLGISLLNPLFPERDALGQAITIPGPGQQIQKEVGIVGIERPKSSRHDLHGCFWLSHRRSGLQPLQKIVGKLCHCRVAVGGPL